MRPRIVNFLVFIYLFVEKGTSTFSVLRTGAITKWRNTKDWKDTEQQQHHNTEANGKNGFHNTKKHPLGGALFKPCM